MCIHSFGHFSPRGGGGAGRGWGGVGRETEARSLGAPCLGALAEGGVVGSG
jgi:hypothetical protein